MKKICLLVSLIVCVCSLYAQQPVNNAAPFYYFGNKKIFLQNSTEKIYLRMAKGAGDARNFLKTGYGLSEKNFTALQSDRFMMVTLAAKNASLLKTIINTLQGSGKAELVRPALVAADGKDVIIDEGFYVKLKTGSTYSQLVAFAAQQNCLLQKAYPYDNRTYLLKAGVLNQYDGLRMANVFFESGLFEYAEPDFQLLEGTTAVPNDPLFNLQWSAINTGAANQYSGTADADIDLDEAWDITMGSPSIRVAVLDEGVQRTHPDLVNNIDPLGFGLAAGNTTTGNILATARTHGTSCAGIIAAETNNGIGVAGVAPLSKIIPVNITINTTGTFGTSTQIAQAIDWSWNEAAADILSNSWGGGTASSLMHDAIIRATTLGRGGKGAIVVFASGNNNAGLSSPSIFTETIAVGAMSMCYQRKSGSSCDNETFWGGNYGTGLDISAPGVKIATTRVTGTGTSPNVDYNLTFNGTSSATPHVSGVAALVLSINSNLTQQQVRAIIESSARKVGPYTYSHVEGQPNGSWTSELGHGMLNAKNAVLLAQNPVLCNVEVTKPASLQVCSGGTVSLQVANPVSGDTYQWRKDAVATGTGTSFTTNQSGSYDVILTTAAGCKDTSYSFPVLVSAAQGALTADAGRDTVLCVGLKTFLGGGPAGAGGTGILHPMRGLASDIANNYFLRFDPLQPSQNFRLLKTDFINAPATDEFYSGAAATPYGLYMINRYSKMLVKIDTATGIAYNVGLTSTASLGFNGLTYDPATGKIFGVAYAGSNQLYEINRITGAATFIAGITGAAGTNVLISLSADNSGVLYALRLSTTLNVSAQMITINKTTGISTLVGNTGFLANYAQGGDADPVTDELYQAAATSVLGSTANYSGKGLWKINKTNGNATLVGSVAEPWNTLDALAFASKEYKYQWSPAIFLSNANDANPEFTATNPGTYTYTLTVTDLCGNTVTDQVTITVNALPAVATISPANPVLSHRNAFRETLTYTQQGGISYAWVEDGIVQSNTSNSYPIDFTKSTFSQFMVRASNPATGCISNSDPVSFTYSSGVLQNNSNALTVCDSSFYDAGGPTGLTGNNFTRTFTPATAGSRLKLSFYNLELGSFASLRIYDGPDANAPRIEALDNTMNGSSLKEYTASNPAGVLTVQFAVGSTQSSGWLAGITCEQPMEFRTTNAGSWFSIANWESKLAAQSVWSPATRIPNKGDDLIQVRHAINVSTPILSDDIVVTATGNLQFNSSSSLNMYKVNTRTELTVQTGGRLEVQSGRQLFGSGTIEMQGNLENAGSINVNELIFNGTTAQLLTNPASPAAEITTLTMNNTAGLTVTGLHHLKTLTLNNGLVHTSAGNTIRFENATGSASSYINGVVRFEGKSGMTDKLIPIGKNGAYRPLLLSAASADNEASATLQAEVIPGAPPVRSFPSGITNVSAVRYYQVSAIENSVNLRDFDITLPYGTDDGVADHTIIRIAKDNGSTAWLDLGGTATGPTPGTIKSSTFTGFSDFVLANVVAGPLPVTLISFNGRLQNNMAALQWTVENELNFARYEIERSVNGTSFAAIGSVNARGGSGTLQYDFTDDRLPAAAVIYYRLKMVDLDNSYRYSNIIQLKKDAVLQNKLIAVGPNPFAQKNKHTVRKRCE
ncbi:MAG: S8 family serine peptidase [Ferruginibacter sp.]